MTQQMRRWDEWGRAALQDGDIVFRMGDARILGNFFPFSRFLAAASGSRFSHTSVVAIEDGAPTTLIEPSTTPAAAYKSWIAGSLAPQGTLVVDAGAATALRNGKSLLPAGVRQVEGRFDKGDAVVVRDAGGLEIARGLCRYDASEAEKIIAPPAGAE